MEEADRRREEPLRGGEEEEVTKIRHEEESTRMRGREETRCREDDAATR